MILALIPARSGSKGIINKNIKLYNNKPLIVHTINQAKKSKYITDIIVSTDSQEIAEISKNAGANVPFLRPKEISEDLSTDYEFMLHAINWLNENNKIPDMIIHLRPTYPNRKVEDIDQCIEIFKNNINNYSSLRSVVLTDISPYKTYKIDSNKLIPLFEEVDDIKEPYNKARQLLPKTYWHNGCIDITKNDTIIYNGSVSGNKIYPYIMNKDELDDIDTIEDWIQSENKYNQIMMKQNDNN